ncbi:MAG: hypothetical protein RR131_05410 [Anaerovorax sp.]
MNPALILILILVFANQTGSSALKKIPDYFDTFKMELLLDRLHTLTSSLEKINNVKQMSQQPIPKGGSIDRVQESLDMVKDLLVDQKEGKQLNAMANTLAGVKQFGGIENLIATVGPLLSMLSTHDEKHPQ